MVIGLVHVLFFIQIHLHTDIALQGSAVVNTMFTLLFVVSMCVQWCGINTIFFAVPLKNYNGWKWIFKYEWPFQWLAFSCLHHCVKSSGRQQYTAKYKGWPHTLPGKQSESACIWTGVGIRVDGAVSSGLVSLSYEPALHSWRHKVGRKVVQRPEGHILFVLVQVIAVSFTGLVTSTKQHFHCNKIFCVLWWELFLIVIKSVHFVIEY